jgi:hypothetical protein
MAVLYGKRYTRQELLSRVGSISQIAGIKKVRLADGKEDGVEAYNIRNGSGLNFTVVASRALDISMADWCGRSLSWLSPTGEVSPQYYEEPGIEWLRSFYGGLLTTCGLTQVGAPNVDQGKPLGLHGRISNIPAQKVCYGGEWQGDDYIMWVQGEIRQVAVFGENLVLTRRISTWLGNNRIQIEDTIENGGYETTPHMILYHINGGFPVVDEGSTFISPTLSIESRDVEVSTENFNIFELPTPGFTERVYYHDMASDKDNIVIAALVNRNIPGGFGFYVEYSKLELPYFTEWKMNGPGNYVVGMEPGNCHVQGRANERERGTLIHLEPGEKRSYKVEIGVLTSEEDINRLENRITHTIAR